MESFGFVSASPSADFFGSGLGMESFGFVSAGSLAAFFDLPSVFLLRVVFLVAACLGSNPLGGL